MDWEVELAAVIGKKGRHIEVTPAPSPSSVWWGLCVCPHPSCHPTPPQESSALDHVVGFTVANDVSARDWQMRNGRQWLLGKTFDTFCPLGPALVTKEAVAGEDRTGTGWTLLHG